MDNNYPKILLVEDEKGLRIGTERLLTRKGHSVKSAENGTDGIKLGLAEDFDIALIDYKMPDVDGLQVLKEIKSKKPSTVCFIVTAYASYETAIEATRLGAFNYILKPFTPEELLHQIEKGFKQRKLLLEAEQLRIEREKNLLEIAHEKSRLNTIIESISSGVLLINREGKVVYFNKACLNKLHLEKLEIEDYILDKLPIQITELVNKIFNNHTVHKSYTTEVEIIPNGELIIDATCSPVPHPDGTFAGVVVVLKNITGLKKIEQLKSQFVSMVAHEMKTPLAAVLGYLDILVDPNMNVTQEKRTEYLNRSALRLKSSLDLVNDLLDISRMEMSTKKREIENIRINEIINNSLDVLELEINKKSLTIEKKYVENLPELKIDKDEVTKIINNLISNAVKYNNVNGKITISLSIENNFIILIVEDTGIGINADDQAKLFQQFFRAKNKQTRAISGTGLGLSIAKKLIEANHGKISVESVYKQGTKFIVHFPFK
ncbi:MAG: response regulator [Ignavibacteriales bacterium]|nr:response regulator [Ignavibacteriales bacterium]MCB9209916.1 response regulator [Ignavibacteriales bacterium]